MEFFHALGLDATVFILFLMSGVMFVILTEYLYKPFAEAYEKRHLATEGTADEAEEIIAETQEVKQKYEQNAKKLASEIKVIFDQSREQALAQSQVFIEAAKKDADSLIDKTRHAIVAQTAAAQNSLQKEAPAVVSAIVNQMIGKERI